MGCSILHVVTDVLLIGLPVPLIWGLCIHRTHKVFLTAVFALGGLYVVSLPFPECVLKSNLRSFIDAHPKSSVTITSIVRLTYLYKGIDYTNPIYRDYYVDILVWTNVEANTSIICGE